MTDVRHGHKWGDWSYNPATRYYERTCECGAKEGRITPITNLTKETNA